MDKATLEYIHKQAHPFPHSRSGRAISHKIRDDTIRNQRLIRHRTISIKDRRLRQIIRLIEPTGRPRNISQINIRILIQERQFLTQIHLAARRIPSPSFSQYCLSPCLPQERRKRCERRVDVVSHALQMCARVIGVKILVHVEDETVSAAVWIRDLQQRWSTTVHGIDGLGAGKVAPRKENQVLRSRAPNRRNSSLRRIRPRRDAK